MARFLKAVNKINVPKTIKSAGDSVKSDSTKSFFLKGDKQYHQVHLNAIQFIEALGNYTKVHLDDETIISHEKISSLEESLPKEKFLRVHKSFVVATNKIERIQGNLIYLQDHRIPIGQTYKTKITKLLNRKR